MRENSGRMQKWWERMQQTHRDTQATNTQRTTHGKDATNTERRGERPRLEFNVNNATMSEGTNPRII